MPKPKRTTEFSKVCTMDTPVISLTMSVIRERLRHDILQSKAFLEDDRDEGSSSYDDLETELAKLEQILPQQFEITGLELLFQNSNDDDSNTCDEEDYSYDSSQINSLLISHIRIDTKHLDSKMKLSAESSTSGVINNFFDTSISSDFDQDMTKRLHSDRSVSVGSYAANSIEAARNKNMKASSLYTQRRLSVFSDHTNETDDDEPSIEDGLNHVLKQYHTFEAPLHPLEGKDTGIDQRIHFQQTASGSVSSESNTLSSSYANDSFLFRKQITVTASSKSSFDDMRSLNSISSEMLRMDRINTGGANRAA
jgi:hypothetical protein